ncbi:MAG TPA: IPT/TIG domain-containing protein, partial [Acidimicrobiales bacterium]|nr:IPT/TIG domain-containing protein [Acidimicrobiales bacterium]
MFGRCNQSGSKPTTSVRRRVPGVVGCLIALTTCLGGVLIAGVVGTVAPAGAANPAPVLWETDYGASSVSSFPASASGNVAPTTVNTNTTMNSPGASVFDAQGDLWVASYSASPPNIAEFTQSELATNGAPSVVISTPSLQPNGVAFDRAGDLWVGSFNGHPLVEFTRDQLTSSGSPTPAVSLMVGSNSWGLTFDASGDLWLGGYGDGAVKEYTPAQLMTSGTPTPAVTLTGLSGPTFPTFDAHGNLWVSDYNGSTVNKYTAAQFAASGSPTPSVVISSGSFGSPVGMDFDAAGNLWVADYGAAGVFEFTPSQQSATGSYTPAVILQGSNTGFIDGADVYVAEAPVVSSVSPAAGGAGTTVTITGTGFLSGSSVSFGSVPATSVTYVTPYELQAVAPANVGAVDVTVSTFGGTSATSSADLFTYT